MTLAIVGLIVTLIGHAVFVAFHTGRLSQRVEGLTHLFAGLAQNLLEVSAELKTRDDHQEQRIRAVENAVIRFESAMERKD